MNDQTPQLHHRYLAMTLYGVLIVGTIVGCATPRGIAGIEPQCEPLPDSLGQHRLFPAQFLEFQVRDLENKVLDRVQIAYAGGAPSGSAKAWTPTALECYHNAKERKYYLRRQPQPIPCPPAKDEVQRVGAPGLRPLILAKEGFASVLVNTEMLERGVRMGPDYYRYISGSDHRLPPVPVMLRPEEAGAVLNAAITVDDVRRKLVHMGFKVTVFEETAVVRVGRVDGQPMTDGDHRALQQTGYFSAIGSLLDAGREGFVVVGQGVGVLAESPSALQDLAAAEARSGQPFFHGHEKIAATYEARSLYSAYYHLHRPSDPNLFDTLDQIADQPGIVQVFLTLIEKLHSRRRRFFAQCELGVTPRGGCAFQWGLRVPNQLDRVVQKYEFARWPSNEAPDADGVMRCSESD